MANNRNLVSDDFVRRASAAIRKTERDPATGTVRRRINWVEDTHVCGILTSAVTAASPDGLTGATNFTFKIWRPDPADSSSPQQYLQDTDDTTGVNRSLTTGTSGSFCICMYVNGEYWPIWIDCATP